MALGKVLHGAVSDCLQAFMLGRSLDFDTWQRKIRWEEIPADPKNVIPSAKKVWEYLVRLCEARYSDISTRQPYASEHDLIASAVPFLIEQETTLPKNLTLLTWEKRR